MAFEIELSNVVRQTDIAVVEASKAFVQLDNFLPLIITQALPSNTNVIKFGKGGSVRGLAGTESTAYTFAAGDELTESTVTSTATRKDSAQKLSVEAARFNERGSAEAEIARVAALAGQGLARLAASEFKTLFSSVATAATAATTLTKTEILNARYNIRAATMDGGTGMISAYLSYKQVNDLDKSLTDQAAAAFAQLDLGVLGIVSAGSPRGELFGVTIYETSGLPTSGGDDVGCMFDKVAFAAGVDTQVGFQFELNAPTASTPWYELYTYTFWNIVELNDTAACRVLSDS